MKGSYLLNISVSKPVSIKVGALGNIDFKAGRYIYVGSAMNNLGKRIKRHIRTSKGKTKNNHWHIDYLLSNPAVEIVDVTKIPSNKKRECKIAKGIKGQPVANFGCSDCKCNSYLFRINNLF